MRKADLAKAIVAYAFRNTSTLEGVHAGVVPVSHSGDFSDVFVVDADGKKIPWAVASRISQAEMREIMRAAVNRVHEALESEGDAKFEEMVLRHALGFTKDWDEPEGS